MAVDPRTYWTQQMDAAYGFMQQLLEYPIQECGERLSCLSERADEADVSIVFPSDKKLGMFDRVFFVRQSLVDRLLRIAEAFLERGYVLRIEDAYRTPETQTRGACSRYVISSVVEKVIWELDGGTPTAELVFRRLAAWTATTLKFANHTSGSAVDATVVRRDGSALDLGGTYPQLSHMTPMTSPLISSEARRNRRMVCELFGAEGFVPYPFEFWHFSCGDADCEMIAGNGQPGRFGPIDWCAGQQRPIPAEEILRPLVTVADIIPHLARQGF